MVNHEEQKDDPHWTNSVADNQWWVVFSSNRSNTACPVEYGYIENLRGVNILRQPPSFIVCLDSVETTLAKYPSLTHTDENPVIFQNLVDAVSVASNQSTVLVDMSCDLVTQIAAFYLQNNRAVIGGRFGQIGADGIPFGNTLIIEKDIKLIGTERGKISSDHCAIMVPPAFQLSLGTGASSKLAGSRK